MTGHLLIAIVTTVMALGTDTQAVKQPQSAAKRDVADLISINSALNEPVRVVRMRFRDDVVGQSGRNRSAVDSRIPDLLVEVLNVSTKVVRFVGYTLDPPDRCPRWRHPLSYWIWHGDPTALSGRPLKGPPGVPLQPGERIDLVVKGDYLESIRSMSIRAKCPPGVRSEMTISKVAFTDGTGWEGFADGPNHDQWNGRPWTPPAATPPKTRGRRK